MSFRNSLIWFNKFDCVIEKKLTKNLKIERKFRIKRFVILILTMTSYLYLLIVKIFDKNVSTWKILLISLNFAISMILMLIFSMNFDEVRKNFVFDFVNLRVISINTFMNKTFVVKMSAALILLSKKIILISIALILLLKLLLKKIISMSVWAKLWSINFEKWKYLFNSRFDWLSNSRKL